MDNLTDAQLRRHLTQKLPGNGHLYRHLTQKLRLRTSASVGAFQS